MVFMSKFPACKVLLTYLHGWLGEPWANIAMLPPSLRLLTWTLSVTLNVMMHHRYTLEKQVSIFSCKVLIWYPSHCRTQVVACLDGSLALVSMHTMMVCWASGACMGRINRGLAVKSPIDQMISWFHVSEREPVSWLCPFATEEELPDEYWIFDGCARREHCWI